MPQQKAGASACVVNNQFIYVIGGTNKNQNAHEAITNFDRYDIDA